ncbi:TetR/AcrR family transcriptional regulator [Kribbella sindirgiensis]|uniref:TetR/AcrR family transcriptional regulator n=1 Tax=Kribbella sindirgiensis TaxID=1124744 RepID=A0A4R0ITS0_9ACTN|nr:TetR family transcriptional regulator [Kribbella sindirgiensis]TCC37281.1 TetR/AcrR family transcriptional regulator [Kribbella sindirgiensis]
MTATGRTPGRRPGGPDTRGEIVRAARESFADKGFAATSIRAVARQAGVDAALVHHYFDSKDELFIEAMALPLDPRQVAAAILNGSREDLGRRIVTVFLGVWESDEGQQRMKAMLRSVVTSDDVARIMREGMTRMILEPVSQFIDLPDAKLRVGLIASHLIGMALTRYVVELEPVASADLDQLVDRIGPAIQQYVSG